MTRRWMVVLLALTACSSSGQKGTSLPLPLTDIPPAVAAVLAAMPSAQFTEINASPDGVTLFVVSNPGKERAYLYAHGALGQPDSEQPVSNDVFSAKDVPLDKASLVAAFVTQNYPGAVVTSAALLIVKPNGLVWALRSQSAKGGLLNSLFSPDGQLISALPAG